MIATQTIDKITVNHNNETAVIYYNSVTTIPKTWLRKICHHQLVVDDNVDFSKPMTEYSSMIAHNDLYRVSVKVYLQDNTPVILVNYDIVS
jgi:hypothetical protein